MQPGFPAWRGTEEIRNGLQGLLGVVTPSAVAFHTNDVQVAGDIAVETGHYEMTLTPKQGKAVNDKGKYVSVWQKQGDGSWKIIRDISNSDLPTTG
jgi:ketosteroid isomerase-like protein